MTMGDNTDLGSQVNHDLDVQYECQSDTQRLNRLQYELAKLKYDKNDKNDMSQVFLINMSNSIIQVVVEQVKTILMEFINNRSNAYKDLFEKAFEVCGNNTTFINKLTIEMKEMETRLNQDKNYLEKEFRADNDTRYEKLKQDIAKMESKLNQEMKQYEMEMKKINERFECNFSNCARMQDHSTITQYSTNNSTRNKCRSDNGNRIWNNFNKIDYYARRSTFHGKFIFKSNHNSIFDERSLLQVCNSYGLNSDDIISIEKLENKYDNNTPMFLIQIDNILSRVEFLRNIKTNKKLSIALFSHKYKKINGSRSYGSDKQTCQVNNWFKQRWRVAQKF